MRESKKSRTIFGVLLTFATFSTQSTALATPVRYAGSECVDVTREKLPGVVSAEYRENGSVWNHHSEHRVVLTCPLVRFGDASIGPVRVYVHDGHGSEGITCRLKACDILGETCELAPVKFTKGQDLYFSLGFDAIRAPTSEGAAVLVCFLPPRDPISGNISGLMHYRVGVVD